MRLKTGFLAQGANPQKMPEKQQAFGPGGGQSDCLILSYAYLGAHDGAFPL
jgi:hypothetical protein